MHRTHTYASPESAFLVNSFVLEGARSVVVIDTQFLVSSALTLRALVDRIGKPIAAVINTHPHPDHYNGNAVLLAGLPATRIIATPDTAAGIRATAEAKRDFWTPTYGSEYPQSFLYPNETVAPGSTLIVDDIELRIDELGPGEASTIVVAYAPATRELFASDLVYAHCHPWMAEDRSALWLQQLSIVAQRYAEATTVHAGHGPAGDLSRLAEQVKYIRTFRDTVRDISHGKSLNPNQLAEIKREMQFLFPGYPLEFLVEYNANSVVRELQADATLQSE